MKARSAPTRRPRARRAIAFPRADRKTSAPKPISRRRSRETAQPAGREPRWTLLPRGWRGGLDYRRRADFDLALADGAGVQDRGLGHVFAEIRCGCRDER